ncbi:hypothetical protein LPW11_11295 [Geomonas sp. RF6]|uniref:hypothetical protein n=1 Tax=Geomonas sp. RF6 TaxID=2897342 RepID=UPI001E343C14|nr:hypothetical protein [Geomonas sp. RF6]UFS72753.1 hypothetical protein LPW11_11295 [Geomonas sp. RF6]
MPALFPLLRAQESLSAFTALFRGTDEDVLIRLLVLREIGHRGEQPLWSPQELRAHFSYLEETKFHTVLHRLRDTGLLMWNPESSLYQVSTYGRMALSALSVLLRFSDEDGGEIGYITSQLAASHSLGNVATDDLQHLLSRLNELEDEFNRAVLSGSELRIHQAEKKLDSVLKWVEKGTEIMKVIAADPDLDIGTHRVAQKIGQVQSRMLRMSSVFQRTLNQLERQKVHLGQSGLSTTDIHRWLRMLDYDKLCALATDAVAFPAQLGCLLGDVALDVAEFELVDRLRAEEEIAVLPPAREAPTAGELELAAEDLSRLHNFLDSLGDLEEETPLHLAIPAESFAVSSYRLSLAALIGNPESGAIEGGVAELARLPLLMRLTGESVPVGDFEIHSMSAGSMTPKDTDKKYGDEDGEADTGVGGEAFGASASPEAG